jgi:GTP-binding protein
LTGLRVKRTSPLSHLAIEFTGSFPDPQVRLEPPLPEIAFLGRSNVGKSSLLNALVGRRKMARVSASPGKTTLLNVFRLPSLYLIDLPGYGYARASHTDRAGYAKLIKGVLTRRTTLTGVVWLLDVRHAPSKEDREYGGLLAERGIPLLVALTKADKITRGARAERLRDLAKSLGIPDEQFELTSSSTGLGIAELGESVLAATATET